MLGTQRSHQPYNGAASATDHTLLAKQQLAASQRRLFLSPQPHQTSALSSNNSPYLNSFIPGRHSSMAQHQQQFGGSSGNILDGPSQRMMSMRSPPIDENNPDMPYYAELTSPNHSSNQLNNKPPPPCTNPGFLPAPFPLEHLRNKSIQQQHSQHLMELKNRVQRVEWKSADSLQSHPGNNGSSPQQNYYSPLVSTNTIEYGDGGGGDLTKSSWNPSVPGTGLSKSTGKLISSSGSSSSNGNQLPLSLPKTVEMPQKSPEYDQIKSPSEIAKERLEAMLQAKMGKGGVGLGSGATSTLASSEVMMMTMTNGQGHSEKLHCGSGDQVVKVVELTASSADCGSENTSTSLLNNNNLEHNQNDENDKIMKNNKLESASLLPSSVLSNNNLNNNSSNNMDAATILNQQKQNGGGNAESTDCSSLGRSSTSDGDFGTLGGGQGGDGGGGGSECSGNFNMYTAHAGMPLCTYMNFFYCFRY